MGNQPVSTPDAGISVSIRFQKTVPERNTFLFTTRPLLRGKASQSTDGYKGNTPYMGRKCFLAVTISTPATHVWTTMMMVVVMPVMIAGSITGHQGEHQTKAQK